MLPIRVHFFVQIDACKVIHAEFDETIGKETYFIGTGPLEVRIPSFTQTPECHYKL